MVQYVWDLLTINYSVYVHCDEVIVWLIDIIFKSFLTTMTVCGTQAVLTMINSLLILVFSWHMLAIRKL